MDEQPVGEVHDEVPEGLRRSVINRKVAGVAGGIAERFDVDANIVRVIFVVLTCLWGLGAAIYLAMWAIVPVAGTSYGSDRDEPVATDRKKFGLLSVVLLAGALCLGLLFMSVALGGVQFGKGLSLVWLIFLVVLAVLSLRRPVRRLSFMRLIAGLFIALLSVLILGSGSVLAYLSFSGVPVTGGIGASSYQPTSLAQVHRTYRIAFGSMNVDLRGVDFKGATVSITATVAIGTLNIELPPGVRANLEARSGTSNIHYPIGRQGFYSSSTSGKNPAFVDLTVKVGIGTVNLFSAPPGTWLPIPGG
jgi:phage shock protein PspC (stress-responsive transcriptional regulator)